uniref:Uncharacterized protein DKFZp686O0451 n=1 Tax=Homo sapiens TaxID=9606 RepID=Q7Z3E0_HUMAN|nr:hypothetical protein [Homo sapiens]
MDQARSAFSNLDL